MTAGQVRDWIAGRTLEADDGVRLADYYAKVKEEKHGRTYELFKNAWRMFVQIDPRLESMRPGLQVEFVFRFHNFCDFQMFLYFCFVLFFVWYCKINYFF